MQQEERYKALEIEVPDSLRQTQEWFASIITSKLAKNDRINRMAPSGMLIAEEARRYVVPSSTLKPHERLQIYNQQYWWRLLKALQDSFPFVARLFGYHGFNEEIAIPYLLKYPPSHWSLHLLGEHLIQWVDEDYQAPDRSLIQNAIQLDWAFTSSFIAPLKPALNLNNFTGEEDIEKLFSSVFYLQPHLCLFKWDYDLFKFREIFVKEEVDYWANHEFPPLPKGKIYYFVFYRSLRNNLAWKELNEVEYLLLERLKKGSTLEAACEFLEAKGESIYEEAVQHIQKWFQDWTLKQWLTLEPS